MRSKVVGMPRVAQPGRSASQLGPAARRGHACIPGGRPRPQDHRGTPGERARVVPAHRGAARRVRGHGARAICTPDERGHPPGRGRHEPAGARVRPGARRPEDVRGARRGRRRDHPLARGRLRGRDGRPVRPRRRGRRRGPARAPRPDEPDARTRGRAVHGDVLLSRDVEAALRLGDAHMSTTASRVSPPLQAGQMSVARLQEAARDHLWLHFTRMGGGDAPIIVRGEGCYLEDAHGNRYLDALAGLFAVQIGYSYGEEVGQAALDQMRELPFYTNWSYAHPRAIELAHEVARPARGGLKRVSFVSGGAEAVESAAKLARQYHAARAERRWKAISRQVAYHGTTMGALSLNGIPALREPFEPLVPEVVHVRNTN